MQMDGKTTKVIVADDHQRLRDGIRTILESAPDIQVVGEASDGREAIHLVEELKPDILLLDMEMPYMNGLEVTDRIKETTPSVRILVLSAYDDSHYILGMLERGASGYITKEEAPESVIRAVRGVAKGHKGWVSRRIAEKIKTLR
jgi:DNA-binding NarL/FixJ family response regulator